MIDLKPAFDLLREYVVEHRRKCRNPECAEVGNLLAWLAHCLGATERDVRKFPSYLVDYDVQCTAAPCNAHE